MVGPHISKYSSIQAQYVNTTLGAWFTVKYLFCDWSSEASKIIAKLFLLLFSPIYIALTAFFTVVMFLGNIINFLPFVRTVVGLLYVCIWSYVAVPLAMLMTIYDTTDYTDKLTEFDQSHLI